MGLDLVSRVQSDSYVGVGTPGVKYPVIIGQFLGTNGLGNGGWRTLQNVSTIIDFAYIKSE
ncbi:MAG TPA: hypothetical protein VMW72_25490 [Sedimentisphaerales bacterium]|nr:hypothetical protein [Sedimentisphaerales bacterium]